VARYGAEHKTETRRRIIETAGRRFKQDGIDGSGISALMADAGLTNGAFYAHFESKDDLVANVVADQLRSQHEILSSLPAGPAALADYIREYLSPDHRDQPDIGCPSAALLDEISRCDDAVRDAYTDGVTAIVSETATRLSPNEPASARTTALGLFTTLVATLQLARAVTDRKLSDQVLQSGVRNAVSLLDLTNDCAKQDLG
jgi:TetR/AcrR family transcriptional regulator, transcriptional repressor for nem operon